MIECDCVACFYLGFWGYAVYRLSLYFVTATPLATPAGGTAITNTYMKEIQENVRKCKNFLSTLMKLASNQPHHVVNNVKNLIQGLIVSKHEILSVNKTYVNLLPYSWSYHV